MFTIRKARRLAAGCLLAFLIPSPAGAWGFAGHRLIMTRAIDLLPAELKTFFARHRDEIVARSIDPDLWRTAGWEDDPHHFLNFGARELGDYPFPELPREFGAAIEKFGMTTLRRNGMLPWRAAEEFGNLRRAFEGLKQNARYGPSDVVLFAPAAGHYIQDAHQPLHATHNYDGQLTGNRGVHARFERDLIERFGARLMLNPAAPKPTPSARDAAFDALLASYRLVDAVLKADTEASAATDTYDDAYFERFFAKARPVLEQRLSDSITATAGIVIGAWEQAGKPSLRR
jgi:hypothetical protein